MMSRNFMDKMKEFVGLEEELADEEQEGEKQIHAGKNKGTVISLHTKRQTQVVVTEPSSYDQVQAIADNLKNRRSVIVNFEKADTDLARRIVDFLSGTTYALNGNSQKVGHNIFLFVPSNVDIASELKEQVREKGPFSMLNS